jgi:hypothetical protein
MRLMTRPILTMLCSALAFVAVAAPARAQSSADDGWRFQLSPYFWAAGVKGSVTIRSLPTLKVDASFSDILDKFDIGLLGRFEGRKGRWGFATDMLYMNLGVPLADKQALILILEPPIDIRQVIGDGAGFYRVAHAPDDPERAYLDVLAGVRYFHVRTEIGLVGGDSLGSSLNAADAIAGLRGRAPLGTKAALIARGDIGTSGSNFAYNVEGSLALQVSKRWSLAAGYRYLHEESDTGSGRDRRAVELGFGGPVLLATFAF